MKLRKGDNPRIRATMEDEVLLGNAGSADTLELEDTNMYQTDSRDRAADRDAEAYKTNEKKQHGGHVGAPRKLLLTD